MSECEIHYGCRSKQDLLANWIWIQKENECLLLSVLAIPLMDGGIIY